jgi:hypothetical protein
MSSGDIGGLSQIGKHRGVVGLVHYRCGIDLVGDQYCLIIAQVVVEIDGPEISVSTVLIRKLKQLNELDLKDRDNWCDVGNETHDHNNYELGKVC